MIRDVQPRDSEAIARIYNYYIEETIVSFEEVALSPEEIWSRVEAVRKSYPWIVYEEEGNVLGYAYAGMWHGRIAYRYSVESTVYLDNEATGRGIGTKLYNKLFETLKANGTYHTIIAGIALPNAGSVALHEKFGFNKTAHYKEVGWKFDEWIDVGYWQLML